MYLFNYKVSLHSKTFFILAAVLQLLTACAGSMEDAASLQSSKTNSNGVVSAGPSDPASTDGSTTPNDGTTSGGGAGNSAAGAGGDGSGNGTQTAPLVTIVNINSSYLQGNVSQNIIYTVKSPVGAVSRIEYVVDCPTAHSVPQQSLTTGSFPNTASAVTIQDNVVSAGAGEETQVVWTVPLLSSVKCLTTHSSLEQANNNFKIRVTAVGQNNLSTTVESSSFQIDSDPPVLASGGITCSGSSCLTGGIAHIQIHGVTDTVTPVAGICVKKDEGGLPPTPPTGEDLCWNSVKALGANTSLPHSALNPGDFTLSTFISFLPFTNQFYVWAQDGAGNITSLSNNGAGTANRDLLNLTSSGTSKIANNDNTFFNTSKGLYNQTDVNYLFHSLNGSLNDAGQTKNITTFSNTETASLSHLPDMNSISLDSQGHFFIKDATRGLVKLDTSPLEDPTTPQITSTVLIRKTGTFTEGSLDIASFKSLRRHFIDTKGVHWFLDDGKLSYIDFNASNPQLTWVAGGGLDDTSDNYTNPKELLIHNNDNIDAFGVFYVLPNQWVVFSADDPTTPLNPISGPRFRLRVYKHSETPADRSISTIYLGGSTTQGPTDNLVPFGGLALSYDSVRSNVKNITGRFCQVTALGSTNTCSSAKLIQFSVSTSTAPLYLGTVNQDSLLSFQYLNDSLLMVDYSKGTLYSKGVSGFLKIAGGNARGTSYCNNNTNATDCGLRILDVKPLPGGNDQYLILDQNYLRIIELGKIFTIYSAGP